MVLDRVTLKKLLAFVELNLLQTDCQKVTGWPTVSFHVDIIVFWFLRGFLRMRSLKVCMAELVRASHQRTLLLLSSTVEVRQTCSKFYEDFKKFINFTI